MDTTHIKEKAMQSVLVAFAEELKITIEPTYTVGKNTHAIVCENDCVYAGAQRLQVAAEAVLTEVRKENDYQKEKAAVKLLHTLQTYVIFSAALAELNVTYTENIHQFLPLVPGASDILKAGMTTWDEMKKTI